MVYKTKFCCCFCEKEVGIARIPKLTVRPLSNCRTLLKDCLLRKGEFAVELIDDIVSKGKVITLCQSHAPDYLVLAYQLGYVKKCLIIDLTDQEREQYVAKSALAKAIIEKERQMEKDLRAQEEMAWKWRDEREQKTEERKRKRMERLQKVVENKEIRKRTRKVVADNVFAKSRFVVTGGELQSLIDTAMGFRCSCVTPVTNVHTERIVSGAVHGAKAEIVCTACGVKRTWVGGGGVREVKGEEEYGNGDAVYGIREEEYSNGVDEYDMKEEYSGEVGAGFSLGESSAEFYRGEDQQTFELFSVKQETIEEEGRKSGYSGDFDLHTTLSVSPSSSSEVLDHSRLIGQPPYLFSFLNRPASRSPVSLSGIRFVPKSAVDRRSDSIRDGSDGGESGSNS